MYHGHTSEGYPTLSNDLHSCMERLSRLALSPARDLDNLSSYLTASFSSTASYSLPQTPPSPSPSQSATEQIANSSPSTAAVESNVHELSNFKFGTSIVLAYPCDMIASNGRTILSYVVERNFLNYSTVVGVNLSSNKVYRLLAPITANNARLWDMAWCPWSKFYLM